MVTNRSSDAPGNERASADQDFQTHTQVSMSFAHAMNDTYTNFLAPLLPALIARFALSKTEAGLLALMQSYPSLLQPVIGHLSNRVNLRYFVILAPAITSMMMSLLGVAPRYGVLVLLVMIAGLSSASVHAVAPAIAGRFSGWRLGRGMGMWMVGGALGATIGPIIVVSTVKLLGLEGTPWLMIGGWLASAVLFLRLRQLPASLPMTHETPSWRAALRALRPLLIPVAGMTLMRGPIYAATFIFLPIFLAEQGASLWFAGVAVSIVAGAGIIGALLGGWMSDRWGRRLVLVICVLLAALLMFVLLGVSGWTLLPVLIGIGIVMPPAQAIMMAVVQENCPENRALANSLYHSLVFISEAGAATVLGALGDLFGLHLAYTASAVVLLLSLPLVLLLPQGASVPRSGPGPR